MLVNENIWLITADLGFGMWGRIQNDFPDRFLNVGASEQAMIGIAAGMAKRGKIPVCYSITPFLLYRPFEVIRNYINHESLNVKLVGSGRDDDYEHDGFSHHAFEDKDVMKIFENIEAVWPETKEDMTRVVEDMVTHNGPYYINLKR